VAHGPPKLNDLLPFFVRRASLNVHCDKGRKKTDYFLAQAAVVVFFEQSIERASFGLLAARLKPKRRCVRPRALIRRSRKLGTIFPTYWTSKVAQKPQSIVCGARSRLHRTTPTRCLTLRFCYSEVVGTRKRWSAGGNILPVMLNLNGQHAHVDP
jgi:hypothetical protein